MHVHARSTVCPQWMSLVLSHPGAPVQTLLDRHTTSQSLKYNPSPTGLSAPTFKIPLSDYGVSELLIKDRGLLAVLIFRKK